MRDKGNYIERLRNQELIDLFLGNIKCPNCNKPEKHYVPPSLNEEGFYICESIK